MLLQDSVKPISYVKAHTAEIIRDITENRKTVIITQNGEAKAVLQDIAEYERTQESLAMLKILALGRKDLDAGQVKPAGEAFTRVRERIHIRRQP
jgi:prevent-host-death family protein